MDGRGTLFREIHKNTWLKRVIADNRKIPVGIKVIHEIKINFFFNEIPSFALCVCVCDMSPIGLIGVRVF